MGDFCLLSQCCNHSSSSRSTNIMYFVIYGSYSGDNKALEQLSPMTLLFHYCSHCVLFLDGLCTFDEV